MVAKYYYCADEEGNIGEVLFYRNDETGEIHFSCDWYPLCTIISHIQALKTNWDYWEEVTCQVYCVAKEDGDKQKNLMDIVHLVYKVLGNNDVKSVLLTKVVSKESESVETFEEWLANHNIIDMTKKDKRRQDSRVDSVGYAKSLLCVRETAVFAYLNEYGKKKEKIEE